MDDSTLADDEIETQPTAKVTAGDMSLNQDADTTDADTGDSDQGDADADADDA